MEFIKIILYLLLALAFFEQPLRGTGAILFIFGIFAIICLTFAEIKRWKDELVGYLFITPFMLIFLFTLIKSLYKDLFKKEMARGIASLGSFLDLFFTIFSWPSIAVILGVMIILLLALIKRNWNKEKVANLLKKMNLI